MLQVVQTVSKESTVVVKDPARLFKEIDGLSTKLDDAHELVWLGWGWDGMRVRVWGWGWVGGWVGWCLHGGGWMGCRVSAVRVWRVISGRRCGCGCGFGDRAGDRRGQGSVECAGVCRGSDESGRRDVW